MRVRLNLATKPLQTHRPFLAAAGLTAFLGSLVLVLLGWHVYSARQAEAVRRTRTAENRAELTALLRKRAELEKYFSQPDISKLSDRAAFFNSVIDQSSFNWTQMFMDLEHVLPAGVRVVSIEPQLVSGNMEVKLEVAAASDEAKLKFLRTLEASKVFTRIVLTGEHSPSESNAGDRTVMELKVVYSRI
jgi:type IV pilus assembly protein PilN